MIRFARVGFGQSEVLGKFESELKVWNLDRCITIVLLYSQSHGAGLGVVDVIWLMPWGRE